METVKKAWAKMDTSTRMFVVFECLFLLFLFLEMITTGVSLSYFIDYFLFAIVLLPVVYSSKAYDVWKEPLLKVKASFGTSESLKDGETEDK